MDHLKQCLRERGLDYSQDDLRRAWESPDSRELLIAWVGKYVTQDTMLSPDELRLWEKLNLQKQTDSEFKLRPVADGDLHNAIASLQSSTAAIEKQRKVLEIQRAALQALRRRNEADDTLNATVQQRSPGAGHLEIAVEELQQSLREDFNAIGKHVESTIRSIMAYAAERLDADDKSLDAITRLHLGSSPDSSGPDVKAVEQWCNALISSRTAAVRAAIDDTYENELEQATHVTDQEGTDGVNHSELHALQAELDSLRAEIASVAEMVVEHEFRKPITLNLEASEVNQVISRKAWFDYISSSLKYITNRANALSRHASELHGFQSALTEVEDVFTAQAGHATQEPIPSPKLERSTSGLRPLLLGRSASGTIDTDNPLRLLRMLDAEIETDKDAMTKSQLQTLLQSRLLKSELHKLTAETSNLNVLQEHLGHEAMEAGAVLGALYANSTFSERTLRDPVVDKKLANLEAAVDQMGEGISGVEVMLGDPLPAGAQKLTLKYKK